MAAVLPTGHVIHCDGCRREATPEHLRERIARLEFASRFRPIHVSTLFLTLAPPRAFEDFFYYPKGFPRSAEALALYEDLTAVAGAPEITDGHSREPSLAAFQRRGFFYASCIECPLEHWMGDDPEKLLARLIPSLVLRICRSYRAHAVLLLSDSLDGLGEALISAGLERRLLVARGAPAALPRAEDVAARQRFRNRLVELVRGSVSD